MLVKRLCYEKGIGKIQKTEINTYIDEFVKARQKYFTDGQEWLEAKVTDEKIYVQIDQKQLEEELDDMIKNKPAVWPGTSAGNEDSGTQGCRRSRNQLHGQWCRKLEMRPDLCSGSRKSSFPEKDVSVQIA